MKKERVEQEVAQRSKPTKSEQAGPRLVSSLARTSSPVLPHLDMLAEDALRFIAGDLAIEPMLASRQGVEGHAGRGLRLER